MIIVSQLPTSWRMMANRPNRFIFSILGVAFSVLIMFMEMGFFNGLNDSQANLPPIMDADLVISSPNKRHLKSGKKFFRLIADQASQFKEVEAISHCYYSVNFWQNPDTGFLNRALFIGVDLENPMLNVPALKEHLEQLRLPDTILYDRLSRRELGDIEVGTKTVVGKRKHEVKVVGLFELGPNFSYEGHVIMSHANFLQVNGGKRYGRNQDWIDLAFVRLAPGTDVEAMKNRMKKELVGDVKIHTPAELHKREVIVTTKESPSGVVFGVGLLVGVVIGTIICYQILFNEVSDNIAQFATVKALGHPPQFLTGIVIGNALILGLFGFMIGLLGSFGIYALIEWLTQIRMQLTEIRIAFIFLLTLGMCVFAGILALRKVLQADPADLF